MRLQLRLYLLLGIMLGVLCAVIFSVSRLIGFGGFVTYAILAVGLKELKEMKAAVPELESISNMPLSLAKLPAAGRLDLDLSNETALNNFGLGGASPLRDPLTSLTTKTACIGVSAFRWSKAVSSR